MKVTFVGLLLVGGATACQLDDSLDRTPVEQNEIGVTQIEIERGMWDDSHRLLVLRGLDDDGEVIATLTSRDRILPYFWRPGTPLPRGPEGWDIDISVQGESFYSIGDAPRSETLPDAKELASFVQIKEVATAISSEIGLAFVRPDADDGEVALAAQNCSGSAFPGGAGGMGNPPQCCRDGNLSWHEIPQGTNAGKVAQRSSGTPCSDGPSDFSCGIDEAGNNHGMCWYGPAGWHADGLIIASPWDLNEAGVYHPTGSNWQKCGRTNGEGYSSPSSGNAGWYSGVTSSNSGRACCYGGGVVGDPQDCLADPEPDPLPPPACTEGGAHGCDDAPCCDSQTSCVGDLCKWLI